MKKEAVKILVFCFILFFGFFRSASVFAFWNQNEKKEEEIKKAVEKEVLSREYVKTLRWVVSEYQKLADEEQGKKCSSTQVNSTQVKIEKGEEKKEQQKVEVSSEESFVDVLTNRCGYVLQFFIQGEEGEKRLKEAKVGVSLKGVSVNEVCKDLLAHFENVMSSEFLVEKEENKIKVADVYKEVYSGNFFVERLKEKIGQLLVHPKAKAVFYPDGRVEVWDNKKGQTNVAEFLENLYKNEFFNYEYFVEFEEKGFSKGTYSGWLYPQSVERLGVEGKIFAEKKTDGIYVSIFHLRGIKKTVIFSEEGGEKEFWEGQIKVRIRLKKNDRPYKVKLSDKPKFEG